MKMMIYTHHDNIRHTYYVLWLMSVVIWIYIDATVSSSYTSYDVFLTFQIHY